MDDNRLRQARAVSAEQEISTELRLPAEQALAKQIRQRVVTAWSHLNIAIEPFVIGVMRGLDSAIDQQGTLDSLAVEELFLCYACSTGSEVALEAFAREYEGELRSAASKLRLAASSYDDVRQAVWNRLFFATDGHAPIILDYRGTGPLHHWFRVLAARAILDETRKDKRAEAFRASVKERVLSEAVPNADPELDHIRERYKQDFRSAFERAVGRLTPEERNLLRCAYLKAMSTDEIGRAFGMHKATAARRLTKARDKLLALTRTELKLRLGADSGELDSVIRLFDGELSISISRLLR